jgi:hypothetical protein
VKRKPVRRTHARATETPRSVSAGEPRPLAYPSLSEALRSSGSLVRRGLALAASAGFVSLAACADPVCASSATGELAAHVKSAVDRALDLEGGQAIDELVVGAGIRPHPVSYALPGEAPAIPMPAPPSPP